jgi:hypothetical protein
MWRRYSPRMNRPFAAMSRTSHSPCDGNSVGMGGGTRAGFGRTLTKRTTSARGGSHPNGVSVIRRIRSRAWQRTTSESNGSLRRNSARSRVSCPGFQTMKVPAAPTFTTSWSPSSRANTLGRNVLYPPTLTPRRKTTTAIYRASRLYAVLPRSDFNGQQVFASIAEHGGPY